MNLITNKKDIKRIKTYIEGFDENLQGGIPENHVVLLSGTGGTMKSSIAFNILYNEALAGKVSLYLTLEQSYESLIQHMVNLDMDLSKVEIAFIDNVMKVETELKKLKKGGIVIADLGSIRKKSKDVSFSAGMDWLNAVKNLTKKARELANCQLFVLDSLSALYALTKFDDPRTKLFYIFEYLKDLEMTSFLIAEVQLKKGVVTEFGVEEYLADGIISLQLTERYRKVTREISVVKMRATACNNDIFTLEYKNRKFHALYGGKTPII